MDPEWDDRQPIYVQVHDRIVTMILEGRLKEGDALPSVRSFASSCRINPITVLKGYQRLVEEGLVEKRRGLGMFVTEGARRRLGDNERKSFLDREWPQIVARIRRLDLDPGELLKTFKTKK